MLQHVRADAVNAPVPRYVQRAEMDMPRSQTAAPASVSADAVTVGLSLR